MKFCALHLEGVEPMVTPPKTFVGQAKVRPPVAVVSGGPDY
jgi:hypothetical protein